MRDTTRRDHPPLAGHRIGEVARQLGVSRDTIRRHDRVCSPYRDWAGHRRYSAADVARIRRRLFTDSD